MSRVIEIRPKAAADIDHYFLFIAEGSIEAAVRFFDSVHETIRAIAQWPALGHRRQWSNPELSTLWSRAVDGFPNHLVFYRLPDAETVRIVRVLHGAMDLEHHLEDESTEDQL